MRRLWLVRRRWQRLTLQKVRDPILFLAGLAGIGYETIIDKADKPTLIIAFVGMMGLPLFTKPDAEPPTPPSVDGGIPVEPKPKRPKPGGARRKGGRHD